jgi:hypothetical protein
LYGVNGRNLPALSSIAHNHPSATNAIRIALTWLARWFDWRQALVVVQMARANPTWGQERMANELLLKLGLRVSPRTVRSILPTIV